MVLEQEIIEPDNAHSQDPQPKKIENKRFDVIALAETAHNRAAGFHKARFQVANCTHVDQAEAVIAQQNNVARRQAFLLEAYNIAETMSICGNLT